MQIIKKMKPQNKEIWLGIERNRCVKCGAFEHFCIHTIEEKYHQFFPKAKYEKGKDDEFLQHRITAIKSWQENNLKEFMEGDKK